MISPEGSSRYLVLGDAVIDREANRVLRDGELTKVEPKVMSLLLYLADRPGELVGKDQILRDVWGVHVVDEALHRAVSLLRTALGDDAKSPRVLQTVPGRGYRLLVRPAVQATAEAASPAASDRRWPRAAAAALAVLVLGFVAGRLSAGRLEPATAPPAPKAGAPTAGAAPLAPR